MEEAVPERRLPCPDCNVMSSGSNYCMYSTFDVLNGSSVRGHDDLLSITIQNLGMYPAYGLLVSNYSVRTPSRLLWTAITLSFLRSFRFCVV